MARHILVTGGAGYIGSHACKALRASGYVPVTVDSLITGWQDAVRFGPFERAELSDRARLNEVFARWKPEAVMHFAALSLVGDSMRDPGLYWRHNVVSSLTLIEAALGAGCRRIVFSSTCAVYGDHDGVTLDENTPQHPLTAYGKSKRAIEDMLADFGASHGLNAVVFRYFNVAGADPEGEIGEFHRPETHLVPLMLDAIDGKRPELTVFGTDYPTPDGTCVRDYIHVTDLADAHVRGLRWLEEGHGSRAFNLGTGHGFSVREVLDQARHVTNRPVPVTFGARRPGDAASLVSGSRRAAEDLGWTPAMSTIDRMIADAWRWHQNGRYER
jgi:UDP-glucose 4-epimerase